MTNSEGGTDDEEFRVAAVVDRVNTTMQVWMGMTMGCAQCHTHKYDPITQEEYYRRNPEPDRGPRPSPRIPVYSSFSNRRLQETTGSTADQSTGAETGCGPDANARDPHQTRR